MVPPVQGRPPAPALALDICRRIGANPDGPVGSRLIDACAALPPESVPPDGPERDALIGRLIDGATNRETYFFRDRRQLALLQALLRGRAQPLSLWSAGCATGEEAYSLMILLQQGGMSGRTIGTDISRAALVAAEAALYRTGPMSPCREVGPEDAVYLPETPDGRRVVTPAVRGAVRFQEHNILAGPPLSRPFDAVVCRNVLIYMNEAARVAAFLVLATAVRPGGLLLLGPGDPAPPIDPAAHGFQPLFRDGAGLFVKGEADGR